MGRVASGPTTTVGRGGPRGRRLTSPRPRTPHDPTTRVSGRTPVPTPPGVPPTGRGHQTVLGPRTIPRRRPGVPTGTQVAGVGDVLVTSTPAEDLVGTVEDAQRRPRRRNRHSSRVRTRGWHRGPGRTVSQDVCVSTGGVRVRVFGVPRPTTSWRLWTVPCPVPK